MKKVVWIILILLFALPLSMATAQDPAPNTTQDNACYEGGSMAGKCDTEWEWVCGWYLARWEANGGWNAVGNSLNNACASLLPPRPAENFATDSSGSAVVAGPGCIPFFGGFYVNFVGFSIAAPTIIYDDTNCTNDVSMIGTALVYAADIVAAEALCQNTFGLAVFNNPAPNIYTCI